VSELTFVGDAPFAILYWINSPPGVSGPGVGAPITVPLRKDMLRRAAGRTALYFYRDVTTDPRYVDAAEIAPESTYP
jgi:hypothetical protein